MTQEDEHSTFSADSGLKHHWHADCTVSTNAHFEETTMKLELIQTGPAPFADQFEIDHFPFILGRSSTCDHQVFHPMVSRKHCEFKCASSGLLIEDLHSSNGTYVNGHRVRARE